MLNNAYLLRFVYDFLFHFVLRVFLVVVYSKRQCYSEIHFVELKTEQNKYIINLYVRAVLNVCVSCVCLCASFNLIERTCHSRQNEANQNLTHNISLWVPTR